MKNNEDLKMIKRFLFNSNNSWANESLRISIEAFLDGFALSSILVEISSTVVRFTIKATV